MFDRIWRDVVLFTGDVHTLNAFPWFSWSSKEHRVKFDELLEALPLIRFGDIGLHRDIGYLSNLAIPGFMKHAWLFTEDGRKPQIVEAISEGVVKRNALYPMFSDYTIVLSPKRVTGEDRKGACLKANRIVGVRYDHNFDFDIEDELHYYNGSDKDSAVCDLQDASRNLAKFDYGFSCTEVVSFAWWHCREQLRIYRDRHLGNSVVLADGFLHDSWEIRWASESVTLDVAAKLGLHEEGIEMIRRFRS